MNHLVCDACRLTFYITDAGTSDLFHGTLQEYAPFHCNVCSGELTPFKGEDLPAETVTAYQWIPLTSEEFFGAQKGMGLPNERGCTKEVVEKLLLSSPVVRVICRSIPNTTRSVVEALVLENDYVIFMGSSAHGATVYRIVQLSQSGVSNAG